MAVEKEKLKGLEERIAELEKEKDKIKKEEIKKPKDLVKNLEAIFILGRGQTLGKCPVEKPPDAEFWGCNNVYRARKLDRLFIMHDLYEVAYKRQKNLIDEVNQHNFPIYTLGEYKELNNNVRYPIQEVINEFETAYILNNACYMLALAIMQKPKHLYLFGVDMNYGTNNEYMYNEKACVEAWLGMANGRGIKYHIAEGSTVLKRREVSNFYGMEKEPESGGMGFRLKPKYSWGNKEGKCAYRYKMIKILHNL